MKLQHPTTKTLLDSVTSLKDSVFAEHKVIAKRFPLWSTLQVASPEGSRLSIGRRSGPTPDDPFTEDFLKATEAPSLDDATMSQLEALTTERRKELALPRSSSRPTF